MICANMCESVVYMYMYANVSGDVRMYICMYRYIHMCVSPYP